MEKETHQQIDRIEMKIDRFMNDFGIYLNVELNEMIVEFIDFEVYGEKGRLNHLKNDEKIKQIYDELKKESEQEEEIEGSPKDEYKQKNE